MLRALFPLTQQFQNKNGSNLVSGKIYIYYQGRTALATTYHDEDGKVVNSNPVLLDNNGRATVFADTAYSYTIVVCDYYGKELFSQDITLHDVTESADEITLIGSDGSIHIDTSSSGSVKTFDMSANTDILATKKSVVDLDVRVKKNADDIKVISGNVENIATEMSGKKDRQSELTFNGSATKTVKSITQDINGEMNVVFEDIDLPQEVPNVEITSEDSSVQITETTDTQTNTKKFDLSVNVDDKIPDPSTSNPLMDGTASVGASSKYAREDHVHPSDTSKEAVSNKTSVVIGTSNSKYPTDKAVADFVNSSIATNTANYISNNGEPFTSVEELEAYTGTVTNNDYAFVTGTDSEGNTYYDRYKATVSGSTVTWALEYRLNNSSFTAAQWAAINSGVTSDKANYWDGKQDALTFDGTYNGINNKAATVSSITSRINNLDAAVTSTDGTNVQVNVTQTDGKISAVNVTTDNTENKNNKVSTWQATPDNTHYPSEKLVKDSLDSKADKVYGATRGNFAGLDSNGNMTDSGSKASDFATYEQGRMADSAIQGVKVNNTTLTPDANKVVTVPLATKSTDGAMSAADKTKLNGIAEGAEVNVQADWNATSGDAIILNKPIYRRYVDSTTNIFKVCTVKTDSGVETSGFRFIVRYTDGAVLGDFVFRNGTKLFYNASNITTSNGQKVVFYKVTNASDANYTDLYAYANAYTELRIDAVVNQNSNLKINFSKFGVSVSALPEGATEITPVWVANSASSSGTAPVKVDAYGALSAVPMDSTPTASSTNLMTSGAIKTALDSRIPAPTSTTGTQVLKCINGVIQWVNE